MEFKIGSCITINMLDRDASKIINEVTEDYPKKPTLDALVELLKLARGYLGTTDGK